jgi:hypothetical protein
MRVVPGKIFGYHVETDDFTPIDGRGSYSDPKAPPYEYEAMVSVDYSKEVKHYKLNFERYLTDIHKAVREVNLMNIPVEKITILKGVVQAHPPINFHWRCPFCYPGQEVV